MTQAPEVESKSKRGQSRYRLRTLTPLEQIRMQPGGYQQQGAWAYYQRPDGATIRDALVLYPNGGVPDTDDPKMRAKYGLNAEYYRNRQANKGFTYLGPKLTEEGMVKLVEVLKANAPDEVLFCQEEIEACERTIETSDTPEVRDQARRRKQQFLQRIAYIQQELDPDAILGELKEIARAQQLASVDPNILRVMKAMLGEVSASLAEKIDKFQRGRVTDDSEAKRGPGRPRKVIGDDAEFTGKDFIEDD